MSKLESIESHYKFGANWNEYSKKISDEEIETAITGLKKLLPENLDVKNKTFLDIGSGSGIHSLAALRMGFKHVHSIDYDPDSVKTTTEVINRYYKGQNYRIEHASILDYKTEPSYDVVYSWGVLHHTGNMTKAITKSSELVAENGLLILALYSKTRFCGLWTIEKSIYSKLPLFIQKLLGYIWSILVLMLISLVKLINPNKFLKDYKQTRGMDFFHDTFDWLGGYPYESITLSELKSHLSHKFTSVIEFPYEGSNGLLGTGCFEVTFRKQ